MEVFGTDKGAPTTSGADCPRPCWLAGGDSQHCPLFGLGRFQLYHGADHMCGQGTRATCQGGVLAFLPGVIHNGHVPSETAPNKSSKCWLFILVEETVVRLLRTMCGYFHKTD